MSAAFGLPDSRAEADALHVATGISRGPVRDLERVAAQRDAEIVENQDLGLEGYTRPGPNGLVIEVNAGLHSLRKRFTIAHEIGHTYFYELADQGSSATKYRRRGGITRATTREEGWCHNFAGDLLAPGAWLSYDLASNVSGPNADPSIDYLLEVAGHYEVALQTFIVQLARYRLWPTIVLFTSSQRNHAQVRRVYTCGQGKTNLVVGSVLPPESAPARASLSELVVTRAEDWLRVDGADADCLLESRRLGGEVLTLIHTKPRQRTVSRLAPLLSSSQPRLFFWA